MTWGEFKKYGDKNLEDDDIIDYLVIRDRDCNALNIDSTSRGAFIQGCYEPESYKFHNDPNNNL